MAECWKKFSYISHSHFNISWWTARYTIHEYHFTISCWTIWYQVISLVTYCRVPGNSHSFRNTWFHSLWWVNDFTHSLYIHFWICRSKVYVYGLMTGLFARISLTALSQTYFIIIVLSFQHIPANYRYTLQDIGLVIEKLMGGAFRASYCRRHFKTKYNTLMRKVTH